MSQFKPPTQPQWQQPQYLPQAHLLHPPRRGMRRNNKFALWVIVSLVAVCILIIGGIAIGANSPPRATTPPPQSNQLAPVALTATDVSYQATAVAVSNAWMTNIPSNSPTPIATNVPTTTVPTTTPTPLPVVNAGPPLLGADMGAFVTQDGQPNDHSTALGGLYHFQRYSGSNIDFLIIMTDAADGGVYTNRVEDVTAQASDTGADNGWTQAQASAMCGTFLPRDAIYKSRVDTADGYDKIYFSASLAKLFPASAFTDANSNQVQAGYFDVFYLYKLSPMIDSCDIIIGTQQTNT